MKTNSPKENDSLNHISGPVVSAQNLTPIRKNGINTTCVDNASIKNENLHPSSNDPERSIDSSSNVSSHANEKKLKRHKEANEHAKCLPRQYEQCEVKDVVQLIGDMLLDLIRINDKLPLQDESLTRFHSRVPPGISVMDYLHRLSTHASLSPPILLSMVYYIDKLCALYPAFTITSLTVHRYLIASATVASKGLSDTFWTNSTYARVGGVSVKELGLLELELLQRIDWRIVPNPEVLIEYYRSLVDRSDGFCLSEADHVGDPHQITAST